MTKIGTRTARLRVLAAAALGAVACMAVAGLGYASVQGPASASQYQYRVTICHHTGSASNPHKTLNVSSRALGGHRNHGDTIGPCPTTAGVTAHNKPAHVAKFHPGTTLSGELSAEKSKANKGKDKKTKPTPSKGKGKSKGGK